MERLDWLRRDLARRGFPFPDRAQNQLDRYLTLILEWNARMNLISRTDESRIVNSHFLVSIGLLTVIRFEERCRLLDLGTGAGFPGLPLKIARPDIRLFLVESKQKKTRFLVEAVETLGLSSVMVVPARVEESLGAIGPVDCVVSRAVTDLSTLAGWSRPYLRETGGRLVVIKGKEAERELADLERRSGRLGIERAKLIPFDPFPEHFRLDHTWVSEIRFFADGTRSNN
jgi:16S rRNA (guanine527-N7)-methyltransferase